MTSLLFKMFNTDVAFAINTHWRITVYNGESATEHLMKDKNCDADLKT